jgi:predicted dehydrogenase
MTVSIGVLGTGRIGVMHAELIAQRIPGARLAGVYDVMPESSNNLAARLGCKAFASPDE